MEILENSKVFNIYPSVLNISPMSWESVSVTFAPKLPNVSLENLVVTMKNIIVIFGSKITGILWLSKIVVERR